MEGVQAAGEPLEHPTFVPDGESNLGINLQRTIRLLKPLRIPIAVISNASLIWQEQVREALLEADRVSLKVDAVDEPVWRRVDRLHRSLKLDAILEGALTFAHAFPGRLVTETMLAADVNDGEESLRHVADFLARLNPSAAYLAIPTRPPTVKSVDPPEERVVNRAYQILSTKAASLEYLTGCEGNAFSSTGSIQEDLLSITAIHSMRREAVDALLRKAGSSWESVHALVAQNRILETEYSGETYYVRRFQRLP
ncbi:MAG: hypothetical protein JW929_01030 [Anaerolineales bacterium]|nr:hypothetical protein [Anaerolineales bacterium]